MINFTYQLLDTTDNINEPLIKDWLKSVIISEGKIPGEIQYVFCDDKQLLEINKQYLNHDTLTDIITFPSSNNNNIISGEIYISIERVKENSKELNTNFSQEIQRVIVHGILHLIGYDDHSSSDKIQMRSKEDYYLHLQS